jgi:hypothetical protein
MTTRIAILVGLCLTVGVRANAQVPNMKATVDAVYASATWDLQTKAGNGCFTEAVVYRLHQLDPNWGHLAKFGGQNQWNGHAVDAVLHKSGYAVDIIGSSETPKAAPRWGVDKDASGQPIARYTNNAKYFVVPTGSCAPDGATEPPAPSPPAVDLEPLRQEIVALRAAYAALEANLAKAVADAAGLREAVVGLRHTLASELAEREALAGRVEAHGVSVDALARDVQTLKSRPIPDGCTAQFVRCRLTFNAP